MASRGIHKCIEKVTFTSDFHSKYLLALKFTFSHLGRERCFDLALRHSSVATLLYHTEYRKFLVVQQFRPAVFVSRMNKLPQNIGKGLNEIDWSACDASVGYTIELCAGLIDKDLPIEDIAREEIEEECGYRVETEKIQRIASYVVSADEAGCVQYLFYAEIDETMRISDGGGNIMEGECINKIFLSMDDAKSMLSGKTILGPPGVLYSFLWFFYCRKEENYQPFKHDSSKFVWTPTNVESIFNFQFEENCKSNRFHPQRMFFTLCPITRSWDLALCEDSVGVLIYNKDEDELIFCQRFRPAALVGRTRHYSNTKKLSDIDWPSVSPTMAYTLELFSGHHEAKADPEERVRYVAKTKAGYNLRTVEIITSVILGISQSGDRMQIYYSEVGNNDKITNAAPFEDCLTVSVPCELLPDILSASTSPGPPTTLFTILWFLKRVGKL